MTINSSASTTPQRATATEHAWYFIQTLNAETAYMCATGAAYWPDQISHCVGPCVSVCLLRCALCCLCVCWWCACCCSRRAPYTRMRAFTFMSAILWFSTRARTQIYEHPHWSEARTNAAAMRQHSPPCTAYTFCLGGGGVVGGLGLWWKM